MRSQGTRLALHEDFGTGCDAQGFLLNLGHDRGTASLQVDVMGLGPTWEACNVSFEENKKIVRCNVKR